MNAFEDKKNPDNFMNLIYVFLKLVHIFSKDSKYRKVHYTQNKCILRENMVICSNVHNSCYYQLTGRFVKIPPIYYIYL